MTPSRRPHRSSDFVVAGSVTGRLPAKHAVTELDVLETALDMIKNESRWTQHAFARDSEKRSIPWSDPEAKAWNLFGAVSRACLALGADNKIAAVANKNLMSIGKIDSLSVFNDTSTHEEVVTFLEDVIRATQDK